MVFNPTAKRCKARKKSTGKQCENPAVTGFDVCRVHGANPNSGAGRKKGCDNSKSRQGHAPKGNTNAMKHGAYTSKMLPDEQEEHARLVEKFTRGLGRMDAFDEELVDVLALCLTKVKSCTAAGASAEAVLPWARMVLEHMRELKATRATKDGGTSSGNTPAEVICALLEKVARAKAAAALSAPAQDQGEADDAESADADSNQSGDA